MNVDRKTLLKIISLLLVLSAGFLNESYYHPDEYFQIIEFASYKLGLTPESGLAWEFDARERPWLQPAMCHVVMKGGMAAGMTDPFLIWAMIRVLTGVLGWYALFSFIRAAEYWFETNEQRMYLYYLGAFLWYMPYLLVRSSSENLSGIFFTLALTLLMKGRKPDGGEHSGGKDEAYWQNGLAGMFLACAFWCRFQVAFLILGLLAWYIVIGKAKLRELCLVGVGGVGVALCCVLIDRWGYGEWVFTPWNYFNLQIIKGVAAGFGSTPFYGYLYLLAANAMLPVSIIMVMAMFVIWYRFPRHVITWVTVPFFVAHCIVSHKEARFMFPMAILSVVFLLLGFRPDGGRNSRFTQFFWELKDRPIFRYVVVYNLIVLVFMSLFYVRRLDTGLQKHIYRDFKEGSEFCTFKYDPFSNVGSDQYFIRPENYRKVVIEAGAFDQLAARSRDAGGKPVYFLHDKLFLPESAADSGASIELVFSSLPKWFKGLNAFNWLDRSRVGCLYVVIAER